MLYQTCQEKAESKPIVSCSLGVVVVVPPILLYNINIAWGVQGVSPWLFISFSCIDLKNLSTDITPLLSFSLVSEVSANLKYPFIELNDLCLLLIPTLSLCIIFTGFQQPVNRRLEFLLLLVLGRSCRNCRSMISRMSQLTLETL